MATIEFTISGMTCGNCVAHVTEELRELDGVTDVRVALSGETTVTADRELSLEEVRDSVAEAGDYTVEAT